MGLLDQILGGLAGGQGGQGQLGEVTNNVDEVVGLVGLIHEHTDLQDGKGNEQGQQLGVLKQGFQHVLDGYPGRTGGTLTNVSVTLSNPAPSQPTDVNIQFTTETLVNSAPHMLYARFRLRTH